MKYKIIEDCSPYFIRFKCEGIEDVLTKSLKYLEDVPRTTSFVNHRYELSQGLDILSSVPMFEELSLEHRRVSMFITPPGIYYRAHKDGLDHRYSLNYTVKILDDKCKTCWYSDEDLKYYNIDLTNNLSRECIGFIKENHKPLKSMTAVQGECILLNTDIYHDFDNSESSNERLVLTFRNVNPGIMYFEDARQKLFG
jgi:hypothetical protein